MFIIRARTDLLGSRAMFRFARIRFFFSLIWFPLLWGGTDCGTVCQVKFRLISWGLRRGGGAGSCSVSQVKPKHLAAPSDISLFALVTWLASDWAYCLSVCVYLFVCVCACSLQIPLSCLPRPDLVRRGKRLHLPLPPRVQSLVSRTLLRAHVHPLHPGERVSWNL